LITSGSVRIYANRKAADNRRRRIPLRSSWTNIDFTTRNLAWIASLLRTDVQKLPMQRLTRETVFWRDAAAYRRAIQRAKNKVLGSLTALSNRLTADGLSRPGEVRSLGVATNIVVHDYRTAPVPALPAIAEVRVERHAAPGRGVAPQRSSNRR
jgi:hypothetical protein